MLGVFLSLGKQGFCIPKDLLENEEQGENKQEGEGFGLDDGTGENDASDKVESEDQLENAKKPEDQNQDKNEDPSCKEEKGIEMSENFDGEQQDLQEENDDSGESESENEMDKEMGETEKDSDKLDEQIWGDDEKQEEEQEKEDEMKNEEGKGSKDENDVHNDLDKQNEKSNEDNEVDNDEGLDATDSKDDKQSKKNAGKDIDQEMEEADEEQVNQMHNELEEPPEPEDMDLGEMNMEDDEENNKNDDNTNPFDIDTLKEQINDADDNNEEKGDNEDESKEQDDGEDNNNSDGEEQVNQEKPNVLEIENEEELSPEDQDQIDETNETSVPTNEKDNESNDDSTLTQEQVEHENEIKSEAQNALQSNQDKDSRSCKNDDEKEEIKKDQQSDEQDTGEEKDGIGTAENDKSEQGHQGISEANESQSNENNSDNQKNDKNKQGNTNEDRTVGKSDEETKRLKTIDNIASENPKPNEKETTSDEYQHIKDAEENHELTYDNATENQSKLFDSEEKENDKEDENETPTLEDEENTEKLKENLEEIEAKNTPNNKSNNNEKDDKNRNTDKSTEGKSSEKMDVEGIEIVTANVQRSSETTAHFNKNVLANKSVAEQCSIQESLNLRRQYAQDKIDRNAVSVPAHMYKEWEVIAQKMLPSARELCEQLRIILEPTKCTNLKGDYRTGRRINMKKIIPYIASQFRKDKIWLRRTKPAQRDYKISIAIDDSKSMCHNNSKELTLQAIALIYQALNLLESGQLNIISFGVSPHMLLNFSEQFNGAKLATSLNFSQDKTNVAELLNFVRIINSDEKLSSENGYFENLLLILSDGQNIFGEGKTKVQNAIKLARLERIFLVYVIIDNPDNKHSILDNQTMEIIPGKGVTIKQYLDEFPFPYYVIVRDLKQLPLVLSDAMRQWFEIVNSEQ